MTLDAVKAFGITNRYQADSKELTLLQEKRPVPEMQEINCRESGSALRFLIPIFGALEIPATFIGSGRLPDRPLGIYETLLPEHGVSAETAGGLPLTTRGKLQPGRYALPGNVSSQFITGLLFALPLLEEDSEIILTTGLESKGYIDLTIETLRLFAIEIQETAGGWKIPGKQKYQPADCTVEGDWSQAVFFLTAAALSRNGAGIRLCGLDENSRQGDRTCVELFRQFGLDLSFEKGDLLARNPNYNAPYGGLKGIEIDAAQIPDLVPGLSVCAALCEGETRIVNAGRLRIKESDRLAAMETVINTLGGKAEITQDSMRITGVESYHAASLDGCNDHRIVMAASCAAFKSTGDITVSDAHSVRKSYPGFYKDYVQIGGKADVFDVG